MTEVPTLVDNPNSRLDVAKHGTLNFSCISAQHSTCFTQKFVGRTLENNTRAELVKEALERASKNRDAGKNVIVHSARGAQFASDLLREYLDSKKAIRSMSRKGNCWDDSMMVLFFGHFKTEHWFWEKYATHEEELRKIFEWIEIADNRKRAHAALGEVSPSQCEEYKVATAA